MGHRTPFPEAPAGVETAREQRPERLAPGPDRQQQINALLDEGQGSWDAASARARGHEVRSCPCGTVGRGEHPFARGPPLGVPPVRSEPATMPAEPERVDDESLCKNLSNSERVRMWMPVVVDKHCGIGFHRQSLAQGIFHALCAKGQYSDFAAGFSFNCKAVSSAFSQKMFVTRFADPRTASRFSASTRKSLDGISGSRICFKQTMIFTGILIYLLEIFNLYTRAFQTRKLISP